MLTTGRIMHIIKMTLYCTEKFEDNKWILKKNPTGGMDVCLL
jgi:hypothetical protein